MGYAKDLWTRPVKQPDGRVTRVKGPRWGKGKRWLACWTDPDGREASEACATKKTADRVWRAKETDRERGEYYDAKAGRVLLAAVGKRWLTSRTVDPSTKLRYESAWRLHVSPIFGRRQVRTIRPSEIQAWLDELGEWFGTSTATVAHLVLSGVLDLAVADDAIRRNPATSKTVSRPHRAESEIVPWTDERVAAVIDAHPEHLRAMASIMAACGLRQGEAFGLALEDVDYDDAVLHVRRQVKKLGPDYVYALPKNDRERVVPLPRWAAATIHAHVTRHRPQPYTLPWERPAGNPRTYNLLFRESEHRHVTARLYSEQVWKPALVRAGVLGEPVRDNRGRKRYITTRREGTHQLRHWCASVMLADGVSVKELAEYLGHHDPGFTLRVYAHMIPSSHARARQAIDARMFRPRAVADGT